MKYNIKVVIYQDGDIKNSQCDCPAGDGPNSTCKHVTAALMVLSKFSTSGVLDIAKSCTERLQGFQKPTKIHQGSPCRSHNINSGRQPIDLDPRPLQYRTAPHGSFHNFFRAHHIGYAAILPFSLSQKFAYEKADLQMASHDHNYLSRPFLEY